VSKPFVNRIKVKGSDGDYPLMGAEILSQIVTSRFPGVITDDKGDDYVEVSIRGHINVDKFFKTESSSKNIDGACD